MLTRFLSNEPCLLRKTAHIERTLTTEKETQVSFHPKSDERIRPKRYMLYIHISYSLISITHILLSATNYLIYNRAHFMICIGFSLRCRLQRTLIDM